MHLFFCGEIVSKQRFSAADRFALGPLRDKAHCLVIKHRSAGSRRLIAVLPNYFRLTAKEKTFCGAQWRVQSNLLSGFNDSLKMYF